MSARTGIKAVKLAAVGCTSILAMTSAPAAAQVVCATDLAGVLNCDAPTPAPPTPPSGTINLNALVQPVVVALPPNFESTVTALIDTTGPITITGDAVIDTVLDNEPALDLTSGADINAQVRRLTTIGDNSTGALLQAVDGVVLTVDDLVSTLGDNSDGVNIQAGNASVTLDEVQTAGVNAQGVEIVTVSGPATLDASLIEALGTGSTAAFLTAAGGIGVDVGVLRTGGDQALGLNLQSDPAVCATLGAGSCDIDAVVGTITTDGFGSIGALVTAAGATTLSADVIQTNGIEAAGIDLRADPTACVALGVGSCDQAFTVNNLTTTGARSPGAVIRAVGDVDGSVGVLSTDGEDAFGIDLASDPTACAILGAGACENSLSVGQLTTNGDGAIGALIRAAGPTTADIGVLETFGDNATGIDLAADPTACVLLGVGQCTTAIAADQISTGGDGAAGAIIAAPADITGDFGTVETLGANATGIDISSDPAACVLLGAGSCDPNLTAQNVTTQGIDSAAVLISAPGQVVANLGVVSTVGDNSPGITVLTDPTACAILGAGACSVTIAGPGGPGTGAGPDIDTDGDDSPGVDVDSPGPIDVEVGDVDTDGDNSPGIDVDGGEGKVNVVFEDIVTRGDDSPGVEVDATGEIMVIGDSVTTGGSNSPGIDIDGDDGAVMVDVGMVTTSGPDSDGINVDTTTGPITVVTGPVTVTGPGSDGINVTATGCTTVSVTATGNVTSAQGIGIDAESGCDLIINTASGADVSGAIAGIEATSGTGTTINLGGDVSATAGPALDADGAAAVVTVSAPGSITGQIDLTDNDDVLTNGGTLFATRSSDFGAGTDLLTNLGLISVSGTQTYAGLETLANTGGVIDMRDGATDDSLTIPGDYVGSAGAFLGVDVGPGTAGDQLVIGGSATGSTAVVFDAGGNFVNGAIIVDADTGTSASAFNLAAVQNPLVDYTLEFDAANNNFLAFGTPSAAAVTAVLIADGARQVLYRNNAAVGSHLGALASSARGGSTDNPRINSALWFNFSGTDQSRDNSLSASPFGVARTYNLDNSQDFFGIQGGVDVIGGTNSVLGVTVGYASSRLQTETALARIEYESINVGVYGMATFGPAYVAGLAKYETMNIDYGIRSGSQIADLDGDGWGGWLELGARFGSSFFIEPSASIEYASIDIDDFSQGVTGFVMDEDDGLRGKAGVRVGTNVGNAAAPMEFYAMAQVIHEFQGEDTITLSNTGGTATFTNTAIDTYGRAGAGFRARMTNGISGFIEGTVDFANGVSGGGVRGGLRGPF